jgi:cytochrome c biogenesis protein CcmG/thiol:disulfide interchange protein DsbE
VRLRALLGGVLAAALLTGCGGSPAASTHAKAPTRLPDATLAAFAGSGSLDLASVRGPAVINLWASWCGPCKRELPYYEALSKSGVRVIGIDFRETSEADARDLVRRAGVTYPLYADPDGAFRAAGLPKVLLVDAQGRVTHQEYVEITSTAQLQALVRKHLPGAVS